MDLQQGTTSFKSVLMKLIKLKFTILLILHWVKFWKIKTSVRITGKYISFYKKMDIIFIDYPYFEYCSSISFSLLWYPLKQFYKVRKNSWNLNLLCNTYLNYFIINKSFFIILKYLFKFYINLNKNLLKIYVIQDIKTIKRDENVP